MSLKSLLIISLLLAAGCSSKLETGYEPKRLDMSSGRRDTLYSDPYSQQALDAQQQDSGSDDSAMHRPGGP